MGKDRDKWGSYVETGRYTNGEKATRVSVGSSGYTHTTWDKDGNKGKTTGHKSGDFHKHGTHSDNPKKGSFIRTSESDIRKSLKGWFK